MLRLLELQIRRGRRVQTQVHTANVAYFQRKIQLTGFAEYPDGSPSQLNQISGVLQYLGVHVNCRILLSVYDRIRSFSTDLRPSPVPNLTRIVLVGAAQIHANGRPERHDEARWRFALFIRIRLNNELLHSAHYKGM